MSTPSPTSTAAAVAVAVAVVNGNDNDAKSNGHAKTANALVPVANDSSHSPSEVDAFPFAEAAHDKDTTTSTTATRTSTRGSKRRSRSTTNNNDNDNNNKAVVVPPPKKKSKKASSTTSSSAKQQDRLDMSWICVACREAECAMDMTSDLLVCDGPCGRLFHLACAGLSQLPPDGEVWKCHDCSSGKHVCGFCHQYGVDQDDVYKCERLHCGWFFHEACLQMQNINVKRTTTTTISAAEDDQDNNNEEEEATTHIRFTCPAHWCWTCNQQHMQHDTTTTTTSTTSNNTNNNTAKKTTKAKKGKRKGATSTNAFLPKRESRLFPCLECPTSYHLTCIPPSAKFHELALLCHEHSEKQELPALDMEASMQGTVEKAADQKLQKMHHKEQNLLLAAAGNKKNKRSSGKSGKSSKNPFFPVGVTVDRRTTREQLILSRLKGAPKTSSTSTTTTTSEETMMTAATMELLCGPAASSSAASTTASTTTTVSATDRLVFCLPEPIQQEVHSKPPLYKHIHSLKYYPEKRPKKIPHNKDMCNCTDTCDDHCLNRLLYTECFGGGDTVTGTSTAAASTFTNGSSSGGTKTNCRLGPKCGNRRLAQKQHVQNCKPQRERGKGWGLVTLEAVQRGALVQEYLGDVIDEATKEERLKQWNLEHPNDPNYYIMCLSQGWYVDARETANLARFINHSCDPNCILLRFNVGGYMRDGIFALRDIKPGEFLSYDYHFDTKHGNKFVCRCGSANCRGTMKEQQLAKKDDSKKTKSQLWDNAKHKLEKDKEFLAQVDAHEKHNATVLAVLPGTNSQGNVKSGDKVEWVSNGVQDKDCFFARRNRPFLWRTAVIGSDFESRIERKRKREQRVSGKERRTSSDVIEPAATVDVLAVLEANKKK